MEPAVARALWELVEPLHAVTYFADEARQAAEDLGLQGFWSGYVAFRAAPLGPVGPDVVTALFHGFSRRRIARAVPDAWSLASPEDALAARQAGAAQALGRLLDGVDADVAAVADVLWDAAASVDTAGRALAAANRALPRPEDPLRRLWQATTTLREHRGDGHVAALVAAGIGPVESHVLKVSAGESPREALQRGRAWSDEEWDAAQGRLRDRGWLDGDALTAAGAAGRARVEDATDEAALGPWRHLGAERTAALQAALRPLSAAASAELPFPNPIGLARAR